jgi:hypothetical protein
MEITTSITWIVMVLIATLWHIQQRSTTRCLQKMECTDPGKKKVGPKLTKGTTTGAGYHTAESAAANTEFQQDAVEVIAALVNAAAMEKGKFDTLTTTHSNLTAQVAALTEQVLLVHSKSTAPPNPAPSPLNAQAPRPPTWLSAGRGQGGCGRGRGRGRHARSDNGNYCWSHGCRVTDSPTGATCSYPYEGHQMGST